MLIIAFLVSLIPAFVLYFWLMHGLYDFSLTEGMTERSDFFIFAPVTLAAFCLVLIFFYVRFVRKAKKQDRYTTLLSRDKAPSNKCPTICYNNWAN